jgi:predicted dienelactone hydrolase
VRFGPGSAVVCWGGNASGETTPPSSVDGTSGGASAISAGLGYSLAIWQPPVCSNGVDDDGDALVDYPADPGCQTASSRLENPACDDDLDNDGDGKIDWDGGTGGGTPDPGCTRPYKNKETSSSCGLGAELTLVLAWLRRGQRIQKRGAYRYDRVSRAELLVLSVIPLASLLLIAPAALAGRWRFQSPAEPGLYAVGHSVFEAVDPARDDRTIPVDLWVPVDPESPRSVSSFYELILGVGVTSSLSFDDADPIGINGFPLVIYSHGGGGFAVEAGTLMESLASHGFVVAAPTHIGGDYEHEYDTVEVLRRNRILDVRLVIDTLLARNHDPLDPLYLRIQPREIGVAGYSFGGWTSTAVVGGHSEPSVGPDIPPDPRVRAVATVARGNGGYQSPDPELVAIDVPLLLMAGTLDVDASIDPEDTRPWELATGRPIYRADVVGAQHGHFAWQCDFAESLLALGASLGVVESTFRNLGGDYQAQCQAPELSIAEAQRIRDLYLTAFFQRHLLHDPLYDPFLIPEYAAEHESHVQFQRKDAGAP